MALTPSPKIWQMFVGQFLWSWILKEVSKFRKSTRKLFCCVFPSSTKREIRHFHDVVVQRWLRKVQKRVMQVQSCFFLDLKPIVFFSRSRCFLLSNKNGDCYENVTEKVKSRCLKLNRAYSISFNSSNVWLFFLWRWILTGCIDCFANLNLLFFCRRRCLSSQGTTSHRI